VLIRTLGATNAIELDDPARARAELAAARVTLANLPALDPPDRSALRLFDSRLIAIAITQHQARLAIEVAHEELAVALPEPRSGPRATELAAQGHEDLGDALLSAGDPAQALDEYQQSAASIATLPDSPKATADVAEIADRIVRARKLAR
jgi:hypothetical protein